MAKWWRWVLLGGAVLLLTASRRASAARLIPQSEQLLRSFGGPDDLYDRAYHQAFLPRPYPDNETPAQYYDRVPPWAKALLLPSMAQTHSWPQKMQYYYRSGKVKKKVLKLGRVGVSGFMNPAKYFVAWDLLDERLRQLASEGRLLVEFTCTGDDGKEVTYMANLTDHGPSGTGRRVLDVSKGLQAVLKPFWPSRVNYKFYEAPFALTGMQDIKKRDPMPLETTF